MCLFVVEADGVAVTGGGGGIRRLIHEQVVKVLFCLCGAESAACQGASSPLRPMDGRTAGLL